ncbi:hypothetical protein Hte_001256 [Hypoxylon texense]
MPQIRLPITQSACGPCRRHHQKVIKLITSHDQQRTHKPNSVHLLQGKKYAKDACRKGTTVGGRLVALREPSRSYGIDSNVITAEVLVWRSVSHYSVCIVLVNVSQCNPRGRVWPSKCEYCEARGLPCTVPRAKRQAEVSTRATDDGAESDKSNADSEPQQTIHVASDEDTRFLHFQPGPSAEESNLDDSAPVAPTQNEIASDENTEPSELEQLKRVVQTMEDEFEEILRAEKQKHQDEIRALESKHWEELNQLRKQYEGRVDNLIGIIKKLG